VWVESYLRDAIEGEGRVLTNALEALPTELAAMQELRELNLVSNQLQILPRELFELEQLEELRLDHNRIGGPLTGFERLPRLRVLSLVGNPVCEFPDVRGCHELEYLDVDRTGISVVPPWIGELTSLQTFYCMGNNVAILPPEIGRLSALRTLALGGNQLTTLPAELAQLNLMSLMLSNNPLVDPLADLAERGTEELFVYLASLEHSERLFEAKILLVGEGEVGKSSLRDALCHQPFIENRSTTHGIEVRELLLPHPHEIDIELSLNMWDFGGQPLYRITHQFFFSRRALYLVVWKPRQGMEENAVAAWCRRIKLRVGEEARILVVATHVGERRVDLDYASLEQQFGRMLGGSFGVDNSDRAGIEELRGAIAE
jgi:internalin A